MALHTVQVSIQTIYSGFDGADDQEIEGLARDACEECIRILKEPEKSQAKPAMKMLCAFVSTTREYLTFGLYSSVIKCAPSIRVQVYAQSGGAASGQAVLGSR
jgi:DNA repair/transcription protein MET18/MMS19